jgi:dienelactone hydrolase
VPSPAHLHFHPEEPPTKGVRQRRFDLDRAGRVVPGILWTPEEDAGPRALVLVGHGAAQTKSEAYVVALARTLVRHHGIAAVAIDGPVHGDRRTDGVLDGSLMMLEFGQRWSADAELTDDMIADWRAVLDAVQGLPEVGAGPVGYWGLSMGTILGLPLVVAEPRVSVAVLGLMGMSGPTKARIAADAAAISVPVLFLLQWDDTLFQREKGFELFDAIGTRDKRLHANPGAHSAIPPDEFLATIRFLADRLLPALGSSSSAGDGQATTATTAGAGDRR